MYTPGKANHEQTTAAVSIVGVALELPGAHELAAFHELTVMGRRMFRSQGRVHGAPLAERPPTELGLAEQVAERALANATIRADTIDRAAVIIATPSGDDLAAAVRTHLGWHASCAITAPAGAVASHVGAMRGTGQAVGETTALGNGIASANGAGPSLNGAGAGANGAGPGVGGSGAGVGVAGAGEDPAPAPHCSLRSIAMACTALASGEADLVLAGGVSLGIDRARANGHKPSARVRVYDARPTGPLPGEGCGIVALMSADNARSRGLPVYADIVGWESSGDADSTGVVRAAYRQAGLTPGDAQYLEGHGAATNAGDLAELMMLLHAFSSAPARGCALGAISACIGDTRAAAGVAGLIKVALAMAVGTVPPTPGCERPHRLLRKGRSPFRMPRRAEPWPETSEQIAAVNAMTDGTTHVVLRRQPPPTRRPGRRRRVTGAAADQDTAPSPRGTERAAREHTPQERPQAAPRQAAPRQEAAPAAPHPQAAARPEPAPQPQAAPPVTTSPTATFSAPRPAAPQSQWFGFTASQLLPLPKPRSAPSRPAAPSRQAAPSPPKTPVFRPAASPARPTTHPADATTRPLNIPASRAASNGGPQRPGVPQAPWHMPSAPARPPADDHRNGPTVVVLHGADRADVGSALDTIVTMAARLPAADLREFARQLAYDMTRTHVPSPVRAAIIAADPQQLATRASQAAQLVRTVPLAPPHTAQGIYLSAGAQGRVTLLFPGLADTPLAHTSALASSLAALASLERLGVRARSAVGYSLGEILALAWAGSITIADAARLVAHRAELLRAAPAGTAMARLKAGPDIARKLCAETGLVIAADEGPEQQLIGGPASAIKSLGGRAADSHVRSEALGLSCALHSPALEALTPAMRNIAATTAFGPPRRRVVSAIVGRELTPDDDLHALISTHLTAPIRFAAALGRAAEGADLIIEAGDDAALAAAARACSPVSVVQAPAYAPSPVTLAAMFTAGALQDLRPFLATSAS